MPIRKGNLHKPCTRCAKIFNPTSRFTRLCPKCYKKAM